MKTLTLNFLYTLTNYFKVRKPYLYSKNSYYYFESLSSKYNNGKFYFQLLETLDKQTPIYSKESLKYASAIGIKQIIKKFGKAHHSILSEGTFNTKILFYKRRIGMHKAPLEFHFYKGKMFFYSYTFPYANSKVKQEIKGILKSKYCKNQPVNFCQDYIMVKDNNFIKINDDIEFSIHYLLGNNLVMKNFTNHKETIQIRKQERLEQHQKSLYKEL